MSDQYTQLTKKELVAELRKRDKLVTGMTHEATRQQASAEEYGWFFGLTLDLMCIAGFDGYFKRLNPSWSAILGWTDKELTARPFVDFVHPEDKEATLAAAASLGEGENVVGFDNRYECKDGSYRWLSWRSYALVERQLIIATARDVTEDRVAQARINELNAELRDTVAAQSQAILELSTPIIKLFDEIVLMPLVGVIDTARAGQIIESLLEAIVAQEARVAILDITGVPVIDTQVAQHLVRTVTAARMLGAHVILTGISPDTAQTMVKLGLVMDPFKTSGSLRKGVVDALRMLGKGVADLGTSGGNR